MKNNPLFWQIKCLNEWCDGPEIFRVAKTVPKRDVLCPTCGWVATYGSGIVPIYDMIDDPLTLYRLCK